MPSEHENYLARLTSLSDRLKATLSGMATEEPGGTPLSELADQIKESRGAHMVEAVPERTSQRREAGEEPVTSGIGWRSTPTLHLSAGGSVLHSRGRTALPRA